MQLRGNMLRYAAICLAISLFSVALIILSSVVAGGILYLAKLSAGIFFVLFLAFLGVDFYKRHGKDLK